MSKSGKIIDLSLPIHEGMLTVQAYWHPLVEITQMGRLSLEGRSSFKVTLGTHTGTHMDAPLHMVENGRTIDEIPLELFIGKARVLDFTKFNRLKRIDVNDLERATGKVNEIEERIIIKTGWSANWNTKKYYHDWPYLSEDAVHWFIEKGVKLIGMDTPSPDNPQAGIVPGESLPIHRLFFNNGVILVECLTNLDLVEEEVIDFLVFPLKLTALDGSPARAIAIL